MNDMFEWLFQGLGTEIVTHAISLTVGGFCGYGIAINKSGFQKQVAKNDAIQEQKMVIEADDSYERVQNNENFKQLQKGGSQAKQSQEGIIRR